MTKEKVVSVPLTGKVACKAGRGANKAFTLIELLVVVLIIGILAAVALPQYQKAVEKARLTEYETNLKTLYEADRLCYLQKGGKCAMNELDIELPNCKPLPGYYETCSYTNAIAGPGIPGVVDGNSLPWFGLGLPSTTDQSFLCIEGGGAAITRTICQRWGFSNCDGDFCVRP